MGTAFVYGTLMAPEVLQCLIRRVPAMRPAVISGYRRTKLSGVVFPAVVESEDSEVKGVVLDQLSDYEMQVLDGYESKEYYRTDVVARLEDGSCAEADVYVWKEEFRNMIVGEDWDYDEWRDQYLHKWVARLSPDLPHPDGMLDD